MRCSCTDSMWINKWTGYCKYKVISTWSYIGHFNLTGTRAHYCPTSGTTIWEHKDNVSCPVANDKRIQVCHPICHQWLIILGAATRCYITHQTALTSILALHADIKLCTVLSWRKAINVWYFHTIIDAISSFLLMNNPRILPQNYCPRNWETRLLKETLQMPTVCLDHSTHTCTFSQVRYYIK